MNGGARVIGEAVNPSVAPGIDMNSRKANASCSNCGGGMSSPGTAYSSGFVYAIGRLQPQFPDLGVEKEFAQLSGTIVGESVETHRLVEALKEPTAAYLARQLCWVFSVDSVEAFTVLARDESQAKLFIDALPQKERVEETVQVIVGSLGVPPQASACLGTNLPAVWVDQHLTFTLSSFFDAIAGVGTKSDKAVKADEAFQKAAHEVFARLTRRSDNRGMSDEHRAANYVALRYAPLYQLAADKYRNDMALVSVELRKGNTGPRQLVIIKLTFRARRTDTIERYQFTVDVTNRFPFLATSISPIYD
ncbi:MAG: hypothetical protein NDI90_15595 [Nitrospira sp. BO4]|nr:hypothetical protein [Nitrospira sp. BO4]